MYIWLKKTICFYFVTATSAGVLIICEEHSKMQKKAPLISNSSVDLQFGLTINLLLNTIHSFSKDHGPTTTSLPTNKSFFRKLKLLETLQYTDDSMLIEQTRNIDLQKRLQTCFPQKKVWLVEKWCKNGNILYLIFGT